MTIAYQFDPGIHKAKWNGHDETGKQAGNGVYLIKFGVGYYQ